MRKKDKKRVKREEKHNLFINYRLKNTYELTFRSVPWQYHEYNLLFV